MRKVSQAIKNHITPSIFPEITVKTFKGGKKTVYVKFSGDQQPYLAHNVARIRQADEDLVMSQEMYSEMSKDMETFATGLKRIKDLCDETGCKVEFRIEKDDFVVVFYRNLRETWKGKQNNKDAKIPKHQDDVLDDVLKDVLKNQIIQLLTENNRLNQKQIAAKTGRSIASVQRAMKKLSEQGKIVREGGKRFGHWEVK